MEEQQQEKQAGQDDGLEETLQVWEPIAGRKLTREDARQIRENLVGYFQLLIEWDAAEKARQEEGEIEDRAA